MIGVYALSATQFDLLLVTGIGLAGYLLRKAKVPLAPLILGVVLGNMMEQSLRRALSMSDGDVRILFASPVTLGLWSVSAAVVLLPLVRRSLYRRKLAQLQAQQHG